MRETIEGLQIQQMQTVFIATFWCVRILCLTRQRLPLGPPRASHVASSLPQTLLMMHGVQASAPMRRRVILERIIAISVMSPSGDIGLPYICQSLHIYKLAQARNTKCYVKLIGTFSRLLWPSPATKQLELFFYYARQRLEKSWQNKIIQLIPSPPHHRA